jgi:hypothetical protein
MLSLVSKNKLAAVRTTFPGCSWKLWTVADCPTHSSKSQFHWCFQQLQKYWAQCINLEGDFFKRERTVTSKKRKHTICYSLSPGTLGYIIVLSKNLISSITITILITCGTNHL